MEDHEQRVAPLDFLVRRVYPSGDFASIACGDLAIFRYMVRGSVGDGRGEVSLGFHDTCSQGVDVAFEGWWWWDCLEELCAVIYREG